MNKRHLIGLWFGMLVVAFVLFANSINAAEDWVVTSGTTKTVNKTTRLDKLTIEENANLVAPEGYILTLTVDGVETGQVLKTWKGVDYKFAPGVYRGDIVLTVAEANEVSRESGGGGEGAGRTTVYPFRQALFLDKDGIDTDKSVLAAVQGETPTGFDLQNIRIESKGTAYENPTLPGGTGFNGIFAAGGEYHIKNLEIDFVGDGRSDFVGYGSAVVAAGEGTKLILDNADINTQGIVRSGTIATGGSNLIVKNSVIEVKNGVLPPDYVNTMDTSQMRSSLWISGIEGTTRATSILGPGSHATYINTAISFEGWGGLSTDGARGCELVAINCTVDNKGNSGYGQYNNSNVVTRILGCELNAATVGSASDSGLVTVGDSTRIAVHALNEELKLGLTAEELEALPVKPTIINAGQGFLWHGTGSTLTITGGTIVNTKGTLFLDKGAYTDIQVDGSQGVHLNPGNGVMMQVMDDDEPVYDWKAGVWAEYYEDPTGPVVKDDSHDIYTADETDALAEFSHIKLKGDFYNSARGGQKENTMAGGFVSVSKNMGLTFNNATITGVISASEALHYYDGKYYPKIGKDNIRAFNEVINTAAPAVNNGVIVTLKNGSTWTVTGTSYLTKLVVEEGSNVAAPLTRTLTMRVNGGDPMTGIAAGVYTGNIVLTVN